MTEHPDERGLAGLAVEVQPSADDPEPGIVRESRVDGAGGVEQVRVVVETSDGLVDTAGDRVEVQR